MSTADHLLLAYVLVENAGREDFVRVAESGPPKALQVVTARIIVGPGYLTSQDAGPRDFVGS